MPATSPLRRCHGLRTAVVMQIGGEERVVGGTAWSDVDPLLGRVLRLSVEDPQGTHDLLIEESSWSGDIVDGSDYGWEVCLVPQSARAC